MHRREVVLAAWTVLTGGFGVGCSGGATATEPPLLGSPLVPAPVPLVEPTPHSPPLSPGRADAPPTPAPSQSTPPGPAEAPASRHDTFRLPVVDRERSVVRVLMYHSLGWFSVQRPAVTPYSLRTQLKWMRNHQVELIRVSQLVGFLEGSLKLPARAAVITIDDGEQNAYTVAYPILTEFDAPFALAPPTEAVIHHASRGTVTWQQIREMLDSGLCEVLGHGHAHRDLTSLNGSALEQELFEPRALLEHHLGVAPDALAYPLGAHSEDLHRQVEAAGYRAAFVAQGGPVTHRTPRFAIPRYAVEQDTSLFAFAYFFRHPG